MEEQQNDTAVTGEVDTEFVPDISEMEFDPAAEYNREQKLAPRRRTGAKISAPKTRTGRVIKRKSSMDDEFDLEQEEEFHAVRETSRRTSSRHASRRKSYGEEDEEYAVADEDYSASLRPASKSRKGSKRKSHTNVGSLIISILDQMKIDGNDILKHNKGSLTYYHTFEKEVPKSTYRNYNDIIPRSKEMYFDRIRNKARKGQYTSIAEFLQDVEQISENARIYHSHPNNPRAVPTIIELGEGMVAYVRSIVESRQDEISALAPSIPRVENDGDSFDLEADY